MEIVLKFETLEFMMEYALVLRHISRMIAEQELDHDDARVTRWVDLSELVYKAIKETREAGFQEATLKFDTVEFMLEYAIVLRHIARMMAKEESDPEDSRIKQWVDLTELVYNAIEAALEHDPNKEANWIKDHEMHKQIADSLVFQSLDAFKDGSVTPTS